MIDDLTADLIAQLDIVGRLVLASILGAAIGLEREIHDHPAGMRTHLLVALGSAGFTILSIEAFAAPGADPARIAAQIVTGIGFLGAGAILKEGATIRGLTTAASLWTVAAVGMAAGAGSWFVAIALTVLAIVSLWPLGVVTKRFVGSDPHRSRIRLVSRSEDLGVILAAVSAAGGTVGQVTTSHGDLDVLVVDLEVRARDTAAAAAITAALADLDGVTLTRSAPDLD